MTREEAKLEFFTLLESGIIDFKEKSIIDKIYDDFENKTCEWEKNDEYEEGNVWHTDCKLDWFIPDDHTPKDHYMKYCPKCGGKIVLAKDKQ